MRTQQEQLYDTTLMTQLGSYLSAPPNVSEWINTVQKFNDIDQAPNYAMLRTQLQQIAPYLKSNNISAEDLTKGDLFLILEPCLTGKIALDIMRQYKASTADMAKIAQAMPADVMEECHALLPKSIFSRLGPDRELVHVVEFFADKKVRADYAQNTSKNPFMRLWNWFRFRDINPKIAGAYENSRTKLYNDDAESFPNLAAADKTARSAAKADALSNAGHDDAARDACQPNRAAQIAAAKAERELQSLKQQLEKSEEQVGGMLMWISSQNTSRNSAETASNKALEQLKLAEVQLEKARAQLAQVQTAIDTARQDPTRTHTFIQNNHEAFIAARKSNAEAVTNTVEQTKSSASAAIEFAKRVASDPVIAEARKAREAARIAAADAARTKAEETRQHQAEARRQDVEKNAHTKINVLHLGPSKDGGDQGSLNDIEMHNKRAKAGADALAAYDAAPAKAERARKEYEASIANNKRVFTDRLKRERETGGQAEGQGQQ